jgi:hypothetical protein
MLPLSHRLSGAHGSAGARANFLLVALCAIVVGLGVIARFASLDNLPGLNGDEAWYGLWAEHFILHEVWSWRTPSGNILNPFLLVPVTLLQELAAPAPWVLRLPAALSGVMFVALGSVCLGRTINRGAALAFAVLAATIPTAIVYSRFGWDPSQSPLASMIFIYFCFTRRLVWAMVALLAAFVIHPSNIFLFPMFAVFMTREIEPAARKLPGGRLAGWLTPGTVALGMLAAVPVSWHAHFVRPEELLSASHWTRMATLFDDLFSGVTVYKYIVGKASALAVHRAAVAGILVAAGALRLLNGKSARHSAVDTLLVGLLASVVSYAVIVGPFGLTPNWERYAQVFLAPTIVVVAAALGEGGERTGTGGLAIALACGSLALISVWVNYFQPLSESGGSQKPGTKAYYAFHTAGTEPKVEAAQWISTVAKNGSITVRTAGWWLTKPLQYLMFYDPHAVVRRFDEVGRSEMKPRTVAVVFAGSRQDEALSQQGAKRERIIFDNAGRPFLVIYSRE